MSDGSQTVPALQPGDEAPAGPARGDPAVQAVPFAPTLPDQVRSTRSDEPDRPAAQDPTRTSQPEPAARPSTPAAGPHPMVPQLRNPARYHMAGEHGRGGIGKVSRARDLELGRDVAIKELLSRSAVHEVRFMREALITARLEHPGIVPVHEAGRWPDGTPFYAMKLVAGRPLRDLLVERKTVDERISLLHHVIAVADAIAYAHGCNIIHRDLKPGNVIVGDFGETVVIDWGLAKDLSNSEEATTGGGPARSHRDDDLTSAGVVLGTPAYMAPEQQRGEPVDQRADVYAIGAMLWELCSLEKLPSTLSRQRILRKCGIDQDLAAIIDKALHPDPDRRYSDAAGLAADLKAFKAGARIAARHYSPWAVLTHWTRRHRAFALSALAVAVVAGAGIALYIRDVREQRDRADVSEDRARRSQLAAEVALDALTLNHAELLLTTDPSAALDALSAYHGAKHDRASLIRAEAIGMGAAVSRAKPHTDEVRWIAGAPDGSITSMSTDGTIARTPRDRQPQILARGVSAIGRFVYAPARGLLAYGCDPSDVCLWDVKHDAAIPTPAAFQGWQLAKIALSPDETKLALLSYSGVISVFDLTTPAQPAELLHTQRAQGIGLTFIDDDTIAVGLPQDGGGFEAIRMNGETQTIIIHRHFLWDSDPDSHRFALATDQGEGILLSGTPGMPLGISSRIALCHGVPTGLEFIPARHTVAFSCREGSIGIWDVAGHSIAPLAHMDGHVDMLAVSQSGDYIVAAGGNGTLGIIDLQTNLTTIYRGHQFKLTSISPPTSQYPYVISADVRGTLRAWPLPPRILRAAANVHSRFASAVFDRAADAFVATTYRPELTLFSTAGTPRGVHGISSHLARATSLALADSGKHFVAYGSDEFIEIWNSEPVSRDHIINTGQGAISRVAFVGQTDDLVTGGRDGRLVYRSGTGAVKRTVTLGAPVANFVLIAGSELAVVSTADGALWRVDEDGRTARFAGITGRVIRLQAIPATALVIVGYASGSLVVADAKTLQHRSILQASQAIRDVTVASDGRAIAVVDNDDIIHVARRPVDSWLAQPAWTTFQARARTIALTTDGILLLLCSDGTVWLYSITDRTWLCLPTGTADLNLIALSAREDEAAIFDSDGRILRLDIESGRQWLSQPPSSGLHDLTDGRNRTTNQGT